MDERTEKLRLSIESQRLLENPLIVGFIEQSERDTFEALKRLPVDAKLHEYQVLHHNLMAVERFRVGLETHIREHEMILLEENREEVEGV